MMFFNAKRIVTAFCLTATMFLVVGCSQSTEATKLEAPDGVDWAAIEAEGEQMNELQSEGE